MCYVTDKEQRCGMSDSAYSTPTAAARVLVRRPPLRDCLAALRFPDIYRNFAIHLFVMLPAAVVMCTLAARVDAALGLTPPVAPWLAWSLGLTSIASGGLWVVYVYGYLCLSGGGSPGTHVDGGPTALVDTGPYTMVRHPSVIGKLAGVIGLGVIFQSATFLLGFVPILVVYALLTNRYLQERFCDERFGPQYQLYRQRVPMLVPRPAGVRRWLRDEAAVPEDMPRPEGMTQPAGIWMEFYGYLLGLAGLIALFGAIAWAVGHPT